MDPLNMEASPLVLKSIREHDSPHEGNEKTEHYVSAAQRVFDVFELLENILLQVPLRTLLCSKRVSVQFRDLILNSHRLRQALFFEPHPQAVRKRAADIDREDSSDYKPKVLANPLLSRFLIYSNTPAFNTRLHEIHVVASVGIWRHGYLELTQREKGSWREMIVVQPCRALQPFMAIGRKRVKPLEKTAGLKMKTMVRLYKQHKGQIRRLGGVMDDLLFGTEEGFEWVHLGGADAVCGWEVLNAKF